MAIDDTLQDPCKQCGHTQEEHDQFTKRCNECDCARYDFLARGDDD